MKTTVINRSFQAGATVETYDYAKFVVVATALRKILDSDEVRRLIVVVNTEAGNKLAEVVDADGVAPTVRAIQQEFASENDRVIAIQYDHWGKNPGSAMAVTYGCEEAIRRGETDLIMPWSSELAVLPSHISRAIAFLEARQLDVVGFHRQHWFQKVQWHVAQNTGAIYRLETLIENGFFSADCDGHSGHTVEIPQFGAVPIAGMDDFHFFLRTLKNTGSIRWGMVCRDKPLPWNNHFEPGSERALQHAQKVARQEAVMYQYIVDIFGTTVRQEQDEILSRIFAGMQMD